MPQIILTAGNVSLSSTWTRYMDYIDGAATGAYYTKSPNNAYGTRTFDFSGIPAGSKINSAVLAAAAAISVSGNNTGAGCATRRIDGTGASGAFSKNIDVSRITPGGALDIQCSLAVAKNTGTSLSPYGTGSCSANFRVTGLTLTIDYTEPYSAPGAPTNVALSKTTAAPGEAVTLSWSGATAGTNNAITGYDIYRATSANGTYALLTSVAATGASGSAQVTAPPANGTYYYKLVTKGTVSGYLESALSAYAALTALRTACGAPTSITVSPATAEPNTQATLSWSGATAGTNNALTGYRVYRATGAGGPYTLLCETAGTSLSVTSANGDGAAYYFKVAARGEYIDSAMSEAVGTLTTAYAATSDFTLDKSTVDAGTEVALTLDGTQGESAHTVVWTIGAYTQTQNLAAGESTISFTPPPDWLRAIPDSVTGEMTAEAATTGGGAVRRALTLRAPGTVVPAISGCTASPVSDSVPAAWGVYAATQSRAQITIPAGAASGAYGSTVVRYEIAGCGASASGEVLPLTAQSAPLPAGTQYLYCRAVDSRGRVGAQSIALDVLPYGAPGVKNVRLERCAADGTAAMDGAYGRLDAALTLSDCGGHNSASVAVAWKKKSETAFGAAVAAAVSGGAVTLIFGGGLAISEDYDVRITTTDAVGLSGTYAALLPRFAVAMHVRKGGTGVGIGGAGGADNLLDIHYNLRARGAPTLDLPASWRNALGLGDTSGPVPVANGGTGATSAAAARANLGAACAVYANGYWGLGHPDGGTTGYYRTPQNGLIPYQSGGSGYLGTSGWPFSYVYAKAIYENGTALSGKYAAASHTHTPAQCRITYGTAAPSGGSSGDIYIKLS